jgi:hypothetical protein
MRGGCVCGKVCLHRAALLPRRVGERLDAKAGVRRNIAMHPGQRRAPIRRGSIDGLAEQRERFPWMARGRADAMAL